MKKQKFIIWPETTVSTQDAIEFFVAAGFTISEDFNVLRSSVLSRMVIEPKTQIILAQDAIKLGFVIVEI